jgi:ABC-type sugar transport system ATPase subunit
MSRVAMEGLRSRRGSHPAIDLSGGAPIEVGAGEIVAVMGRAGSGKTALARMICGLDPIEAGRIDLGGRELTNLPPHQRRVGLVMQNDALWPNWTLAENIGFPLRCRGIGRKERRHRLHDLIAEADLEDLANRRPTEVGPEIRGRALLARALALDPELLVIDEPFVPTGMQIGTPDAIRQVHAAHKLTTLVLTANPQAALTVGDRVGLLEGGRVAQIGSPLELYARPRSLAIAQTFGPINQVEGVLESIDGRGSLVVRSSLGRLTGRMAVPGVLRPGASVGLLFRPEALSPGSVTFGANRFPATILRRSLEGSVCRLELRGPGDWRGAAVVLPGQASALREGQSHTFSLPGDSLVIVSTAASEAP